MEPCVSQPSKSDSLPHFASAPTPWNSDDTLLQLVRKGSLNGHSAGARGSLHESAFYVR